jgi:membrane-associated phospholipid phosphatase
MKVVTTLDRAGHVNRQQLTWAGTAGLLALAGRTSRCAAFRGGVCYVVGAVLANVLMKPLFKRPRPRKARQRSFPPVSSSLPSGHTASFLAFTFGAAQELPILLGPLSLMAFTSLWSLVRSRDHYVGDVLSGGAVAIGLVRMIEKLWPARQ